MFDSQSIGLPGSIRSWHVVASAALLLICLSACGDFSDNNGGGSTDNQHLLGDVWVMTYPTTISLQVADHTYIEALDNEGNTHEWMCFGIRTGGDELAGTRTDTTADITTVAFMASKAPCKWPREYYLRIGVCHQCANRALYFTGKTVSNCRGYDFFALFYGTYGDEEQESYREYSMQNCLASAPDWQGDFPDDGSMNPASITKTADTHLAEIELYEKYRAAEQSIQPLSGATYDFQAYLNDLFRMKIHAKLGDDFPDRVADHLISIRNAYRDKKKQLDQTFENRPSSWEKVFDQYASLFSELADEYKQFLTPDEYEMLFNLSYSEPMILEHYVHTSLP